MTDGDVFALEDQTLGRGLLRDYRRLTRLYCMNGGYHLQILPDGSVQGQRDDRDVYSKTATHTHTHTHTHWTRRSGLHDAFTSFSAGVSGAKSRKQDAYLIKSLIGESCFKAQNCGSRRCGHPRSRSWAIFGHE
ncbi:hypothetical protein PAMA_017465 [Pampus argenteus]